MLVGRRWFLMKDFIDDNQGRHLVEYAIIAGLVSLMIGAIAPSATRFVMTAFAKAMAAMNGTP
jgi:Flp pilus assembly pilin Flp